jgi:CRP-like cAMP-binding protein
MNNPLVRKLESVGGIAPSDREALEDLSGDVREVDARRDIISEGDRPDHVRLILSGWAARYKILPNGRRQITAFLIPGDFCDLHITILEQMDHSIVALTPTKVACIPARVIQNLPHDRPTLTRALWWSSLVDEAVLREWLVSAGRRSAYEALAHLMCELHARLRRVGLVEDNRFDMPVTQEELADALGLTPVHVNRMLQRLRREGLVQLLERKMTILDSARLCKAAGFDPSYLHAEELRRGRP